MTKCRCHSSLVPKEYNSTSKVLILIIDVISSSMTTYLLLASQLKLAP